MITPEDVARDVQLRWALQTALEEFRNAPTAVDRDDAKRRYLQALRNFSARVLRGDENSSGLPH
jgi:hypothetical protein